MRSALEYGILGIISFGLFFLILVQAGSVVAEQHFVYLAKSFLEGHLYVNEAFVSFNALDYSLFNGKYYWPQAPFAAVVMMPFVALFGTSFLQGYVQLLSLALMAYLVYKLSKSFSFSKKESLYFVFLFMFGSVVLGIAAIPWSFYFAQILATTFLLLAIYLYRSGRPIWIIGTILGCMIVTRYTLIVAPLFFVLHLVFQQYTFSTLLKKLTQLVLPIAIIGVLLLGYNYLRFDSPLETGYALATLGTNEAFHFERDALFSVGNIPSNLYYYFLKMPEPVLEEDSLRLMPPYLIGSLISLSFFIVAPFFIYAARTIHRRAPEVYILWTVALLQLLLILSYFSPGTAQYLGPRYMLDLLPWLLLLVFIAFQGKQLKPHHKAIIIGSGIVNYYLLMTVLLKAPPGV